MKNIEDIPVLVGFAPHFHSSQVENQAKKVQLYDVIVGVNNVDIRTSLSRRHTSGVKRKLNQHGTTGFDRIIAELKETVVPSQNNINTYTNNQENVSISLSTIDNSIVCLTLARPVSGTVKY